MERCLQLARLGAGMVAPNPMVGAVLVHEDRIIGEGYHRQFGQAHAEVNCIASVSEGDRPLLSASTLYVSLEPCAHHGKTPPCADLICSLGIPRVVIGCRDPFPAVNGKGIEKLQAAGITVITGILEAECRALNKRFFCFHLQHRPYIILKWAESEDGFIGVKGERTAISNEYTNRLVHRWRSEEAAIMVGTHTALVDNPQLTNRYWTGPSPLRIVLDRHLSLPVSHHVFDKSVRTIIFNTVKQQEVDNLVYYRLPESPSLLPALLDALYHLQVQSVMIEGGAQLLQSCIEEGYWDEARVIRNEHKRLKNGVPAPVLPVVATTTQQLSAGEQLRFYYPARAPLFISPADER